MFLWWQYEDLVYLESAEMKMQSRSVVWLALVKVCPEKSATPTRGPCQAIEYGTGADLHGLDTDLAVQVRVEQEGQNTSGQGEYQPENLSGLRINFSRTLNP